MVIQFTLQDLMVFLALALGIGAGVLLLSVLWNIKKTMSRLPTIMENIEQTSSNLRVMTDGLNVSMPAILSEVEYVTKAAKGSIELAGVVIENIGSGFSQPAATYSKQETPDFMEYVHIIEEILQVVYRTFYSGK